MLKGVNAFIYPGTIVQGKKTKAARGSFGFRVRLGDYEVEVVGEREEVLKTVDDLPRLIGNVGKAFESVKPKKVTMLTVKTEASKEEKAPSQKYPKILATESCDEAVVRLLETDWGKWRPRTIEELREALKTNRVEYPGRMLAAVLMNLVKQEKVRRWSTDAGFVYILAEKESLGLRGERVE